MSFLPDEDLEYLLSKNITFEEIIDGNQHGVIIKQYQLPEGKYDHTETDLLILIRNGYPDNRLDMFYTFPRVKLIQENKSPRATEVNVPFNQREWQRWSRHFDDKEWRPGRDGIHTYLKTIEFAIKEAAA